MKKDRKIFLVKNESHETVGTFFSVSKEKLEEYINEKKLYPKTQITIEEFIEDEENNDDVVPLIFTERYLWYELKHRRSVHVVK